MAARNAKRSISTILRTVNSLMTPWLSGHFSKFGLVFFVLNSLLGIVRQWSQEKFALLTLKHRSHVRILIYRTWVIKDSVKTQDLFFNDISRVFLRVEVRSERLGCA